MWIEKSYKCPWSSNAGVEEIEVRIKVKFRLKPIFDVETEVYSRLWTKDNNEIDLIELELTELSELCRFLESLDINEIRDSELADLDPDRFYDDSRCNEVS